MSQREQNENDKKLNSGVEDVPDTRYAGKEAEEISEIHPADMPDKPKTDVMKYLDDEVKAREEASKADREARAQHEKELQEKKIELTKLKMGVIDESESIKEVHEEAPKLSFGEKIENIWYRSKWIILFAVFCVVAVSYIVYSQVTSEKADMTVLVVMENNALYARTEEVEEFLEQYCDDLDGNGYVHVLVYNIVLSDLEDVTSSTSAQAQIMTQLMTGDNILIISDGTTEFEAHDFTADEGYDDDCMTEYGITLNCALTREELKWEAMPENLYIGMRQPQELSGTKLEAMQENFDELLPMFNRIYEAICASEP
ncbi:MAG: hypothetical protein LUG49_07375 [Oscillospiraceae bacterium]|nr:hypothetical protein [Oscillospiraceae bacterium]